ncbi:MAG TPA: metal ABC transporter substrate-binding protein, partial [Nitrospiria bacterium]|nr:metal ABC transporter substrate-binding protein [Nitrospiria bacterium]
ISPAFLLALSMLPVTGDFFRAGPVSAKEPLRVVATFPVLKDLVEQVGGNRVEVSSLLSGLESEHTYTPSPSDLFAIRDARMLVQIGMGLEIWVENLIRNAENPGLQIVTTSIGIPLIHAGDDHDPGHLEGDPHIWLDPENAVKMTQTILENLVRTDPENEDFYRKNQADYAARLKTLQAGILERLEKLNNRRIITHHAAWSYFAKRFGFEIRGTIVPHVGSEPSAKHLSELTEVIRREGIGVIASEPQLNPKLPRILSIETGAGIVVLTPVPGAVEGVETYEAMIKYNADELIRALEE